MNVAASMNSNQKRIVPGSYWYAYGSVAYDYCGRMGEDAAVRLVASPSLRLIDGGAGRQHPSAGHRACGTEGSRGRIGRPLAAFAVLCVLLATALCLSAFLLNVRGAWGAVGDGGDIATVMVAVEEGDTLWSMAEDHPIDGLTTQQCVRWVIDRNGLDGAVLTPGQVLELPLGSAS